MSKSRNRDKDYRLAKKSNRMARIDRHHNDDEIDIRRINQRARNGERFDDDEDFLD